MSKDENSSEKDELIKEIGLFVCGVIATYVLFGIIIGDMKFFPSHFSKYDSSASVAFAKNNPGLMGAIYSLAGIGFSLHFLYWTVSKLILVFNRNFRRVVPVTIFIYAIFALPHFIDLYKKHHPAEDPVSDVAIEEVQKERILAAEKEQEKYNEIIEPFILGKKKISQKIWLRYEMPRGHSVASILVTMDSEYDGTKISSGSYVLKKAMKLRDRSESGDPEYLHILQAALAQVDNQTSMTKLKSDESTVIDVSDKTIYACYRKTTGECKMGWTTYEVEPVISSNSRCECIRYKYGTVGEEKGFGMECTVQSPKSCRSSIISSDTVIDTSGGGLVVTVKREIP